MNELEEIVRIAAKGDGVTASGRHIALAVPGDKVDAEGNVVRGPHQVTPACAHFGRCGGCQLQHAGNDALAEFVTGRVLNAASGQGLDPATVLPTHLSPPNNRRRATLHALRTQNGAVIGFREASSHRIVDVDECPVLASELMALIRPIRQLLGRYAGKNAVDVGLALTDQGVDVALKNVEFEGLEGTESALEFASDQSLARLSVDTGFGPETVWEPEPVSISLGGIPVPMPIGSFLQATPDAESIMINDARSWLQDHRLVADLFAGLGTFAFALCEKRKVLAVEADRAAHLACKAASHAAQRSKGAVHALHRDLFRNPLQAGELDRFDAVLLDPPRAGAKAQIAEIAASNLSRVVYVSCNPSSWSRDAAVLKEAGFSLEALRPIGQFRWSTHVELTSLFIR